MCKQNLVKEIQPVKLNTLNRLNKSKSWKYGYDPNNDIIVISKSGQIGKVLELQGLKIALPKQPKSGKTLYFFAAPPSLVLNPQIISSKTNTIPYLSQIFLTSLRKVISGLLNASGSNTIAANFSAFFPNTFSKEFKSLNNIPIN